MSVNLKPLGDRLVVEPKEREPTTASGLVLPETAKEKPQEAEVVAVGPGKPDDSGKRQPMTVKDGDRVLIGKYAGTDITLDDEEHTIVDEDSILAIIKRMKSK